MNIKIYRFDPQVDKEPHYDTFSLPFKVGEGYTVLDMLNYVYHNLDTSLSYFSHSLCNQRICARCAVKVNGSVRLACHHVPEEEEVVVEPKNNKVVKDLVTL